MTNANAFTTSNRNQFASILRTVRADRSLRVYGRLGAFGRVLIADQFRINYPASTSKTPLNIHRQKEAA